MHTESSFNVQSSWATLLCVLRILIYGRLHRERTEAIPFENVNETSHCLFFFIPRFPGRLGTLFRSLPHQLPTSCLSDELRFSPSNLSHILFHTPSPHEVSLVFQPLHSCQDPAAILGCALRSTFTETFEKSYHLTGCTDHCDPKNANHSLLPFQTDTSPQHTKQHHTKDRHNRNRRKTHILIRIKTDDSLHMELDTSREASRRLGTHNTPPFSDPSSSESTKKKRARVAFVKSVNKECQEVSGVVPSARICAGSQQREREKEKKREREKRKRQKERK